MAEERRSVSSSARRNRLAIWTGAIALAGFAFLLSWPFLIAPGEFLYIRYFDADTIFGPWWKLHDLVRVWDAQLHLGYAHARDLSYISIQEVLSALLSPLGADFRNRSSLICVSLAIFIAFWWYLRVRFPRVPSPMAALAAFFYAANPFVVSFIHDGYSGLLVDYALLPVSLLIIEWARRTGRPVLISLVPLAFVLTGMYNLTSVIVTLIGVVILEYRYLYEALRSSWTAVAATVLAFALNVFWFVPLLYDLLMHPAQPILAESGNDISVLTSAGTLTNAFLLRSYPEIWTKAYGVRECTGCAFYESPWFMGAMLFVAICAIIGLIRARRYGLLAALAASILLATGYHYQNEIIGIPYLVLMGLPTFDMFRSSVKFSALTATFYSIGLVYFYLTFTGRRALFASICSLAVVFLAFPYAFGSIIERSADSPPHFPNFAVSIPAYYHELKANEKILPDDTPTLLLPNMPLAAYSWGAYGNDLLPPYLGKPTLAVSYLPQPSWQLEQILQRVTARKTSAIERKALLRALGIRSILYRDDVTQTWPLPIEDFGKQIAVFGSDHVLASDGAFPLFAAVRTTDPVSGVSGVAAYAGLFHRPSRGFDPGADSEAICSGKVQVGIEPLPVRRKIRQTLDLPITCDMPLMLDIVFSKNVAPGAQIIDDTSHRAGDGTRTAVAGLPAVQLRIGPGAHHYVIPRGGAILAVLGRRINVKPARIEAQKPRSISAGYSFEALPYNHFTIFNQNFDPAWAGSVLIGGSWKPIRNFAIDGFANAWVVPANARLKIVNTLVVWTRIAAWLAAALLVAYIITFTLGIRARV